MVPFKTVSILLDLKCGNEKFSSHVNVTKYNIIASILYMSTMLYVLNMFAISEFGILFPFNAY